MRKSPMWGFCLAVLMVAARMLAASHVNAAETAESLIAGAQKEEEIVFVAGAQTFGGRKGLAELEAAFNKKFGLKARISFAAGPDECASGPAYYRAQIRQKSLLGYLPGLAISPCIAA